MFFFLLCSSSIHDESLMDKLDLTFLYTQRYNYNFKGVHAKISNLPHKEQRKNKQYAK